MHRRKKALAVATAAVLGTGGALSVQGGTASAATPGSASPVYAQAAVTPAADQPDPAPQAWPFVAARAGYYAARASYAGFKAASAPRQIALAARQAGLGFPFAKTAGSPPVAGADKAFDH